MSSDHDPTPVLPGQVYYATAEAFGTIPEGRAALFVRTEQQAGAEKPEHLLVMAADRTVRTRWEDPDLFAERWTLDYTPPGDPDAAARDAVEREALAATMGETAEAVILEAEGDLDLKARGALGQAVVARLRKSFVAHRDRLRAETGRSK